jgi:hypothetical protein
MQTFGKILIGITAVLMAGVSVGQNTSLNPGKDWRLEPLDIRAHHGTLTTVTLPAAKRRLSFNYRGTVRNSPAFEMDLPNHSDPLLLTFLCNARQLHTTVTMETREPNGDWRTLQTCYTSRSLLTKFRIEDKGVKAVRLRFDFSKELPATATLQVSDIALFDLRPGERHDYWLTVGASIQEQSVRNRDFGDIVRKEIPDYDPVMFNLAVSGWRTEQVRRHLPEFLREHPDAAYVCIHIGGNNVSAQRPYPGGAERMREDLAAILKMIRDAGRIPILSRLSYRAYHASKSAGPVPPEENGSGPYVKAIYDPLIREYCPQFFDERTSRGVVDAYGYFRAHPGELRKDGVHVLKPGEKSWNRLWAEKAGGVVYGKK